MKALLSATALAAGMALPAHALDLGALTPQEMDLVRRHASEGGRIIGEVGFPPLLARIVREHHERMDGGGYPGGLAGELIPPYVRALTVADVYDALTTKRPYADAMQPFQALRLMRDEMIDAFDADVYKRLVMILSGANMV